ncbi:hypothetical protein NQ318_005257 [Aromia moschata]|uniref:Carboxylesterase type B domain-containing protein n=1 Tax=Aromia moschata TaxID=1265417 RepID=A0AAV8Y4C3_9CUCU|nr:hypothetical protein NQ318_005257 [Aromia moschata]
MSDTKDEKSEDKKDIEIEEREKMLNAENKAQEKETEIENAEEKKNEKKEGMEEDGDQTEQEGAELIDKNAENKDESVTAQTKIKLPNPFRKSKIEEDGDKAAETKEKKKLLDTIRLPLVSVFPRKKKDGENIEHQTAQAELASMETLDDKSTDEKEEDMKNVALNDKKDVERQEEAEGTTWQEKLRAYKIAISALLVFFLLIMIIIFVAIPTKQISYSPPVKDGRYIETITTCGRVEGLVEDSAFAFRGIPYARPPLGDLRFRAARPLDSLDYCWDGNATFLAHNATDLCMQILSNGTVVGSEDCLTLDVVTPYVRYDNPLPVIVLVGAESLIGGSPGKMRPSARYARSRDVVFVRPNFRLGALGFLALEALSESDYPKSSGNYGLSDLLAALKWVQLNIQHFGGDATSVTLFGHRAGATLVTALSTMPDARKYFARAWASSGGAVYPKRTLRESEIDNKSYLEAVQCSDAECLRSADAEKLVSAVEDTWRKPQLDLPSKDEDPSKRHQWLVLDGKILKENPATVLARAQEESSGIHLVIGTTAHAASSEKLLMKHTAWTEELVRQHVNGSFLSQKNLTEEALKLYPATYKGLSAMISDIRIVCPLFAITSQIYKSVPFYVVTQTRFKEDVADVDSDVDAILGRYEPKTPEQRRYFSAMQGLFYHYVWHGKIEQNMIGRNVLVVGQDVLPNATYSHCSFWMAKNVVLPYAALD